MCLIVAASRTPVGLKGRVYRGGGDGVLERKTFFIEYRLPCWWVTWHVDALDAINDFSYVRNLLFAAAAATGHWTGPLPWHGRLSHNHDSDVGAWWVTLVLIIFPVGACLVLAELGLA